MKKTEVECCTVTCIHDNTVRRVREMMPAEEKMKELADFYKVFGDATRIKILCVLLESEVCVCDLAEILGMTQVCDLPSTSGAEADEACEEQAGRKDGVLFVGR